MWDFDNFDIGLTLNDDEDPLSFIKSPPLSTHCNVPLKYNKQRAALLKPSFGQHVLPKNQYWKEFKAIQEIHGSLTPDYYDLCHVQYDLLNLFVPPSNTIVSAEWHQQNRVSVALWRSQSLAVQSLFSQPILMPEYSLNNEQQDFLNPFYLRKAFFEEGVLSSGSDSYVPTLWWKKHQNGVSFYRDYNIFIAATKNLTLIVINSISVLVSRDHLLILSDLAAQRYILTKYSILSTYHPQPPFLPPGILIEFLECGDKILKKGGNEAYKIISNIEPLCLSFLVGDMPVGTPTGKTFATLIKNEIYKEAHELNLNNEIIEMISLLQLANNTSPSYLSELYGLYRIWGHPTIEPLEGATALKKIATKVRMTNQPLVQEITNKFKEEFICRYIAKEHIWPDLDLSKLPSSNIIAEAYNKKSSYPNKHKEYRRSDLSLINFNQIFPVDPKFDLIELIADKALSLLTPELISRVVTKSNCGTASERSVLINWLKSPIQDPELFLKYIDEQGFPEFEKSNGVREKEREEKLRPRMFGLMTLFKRMYIVLTEALLAEHLISYFPEITMIDDELSLDKKRFMFNVKPESIDQIIISLDFSKWNTNMRKNETLPIFKCFDQMFGFKNCFTRTHEMFEDSAMYLLNGTYLPKITPTANLKSDIGTWFGHLGGVEGLRQKGWTLWTVALILLASENLPFSLSLMGQGDNQILRLRFPLGSSIKHSDSVMYKFLQSLDNILSKVGPPLKLEETWSSRDLFVYGKYIIYKGVPLPLSGKRLCRIFRLSNEDYPTLESALSSATANLTAALSCHYCIGPLFIIYLSELVATFQLAVKSNFLQPSPLGEIFAKMTSIRIPGKTSIRKDVPAITTTRHVQSDLFYESLCTFPRALGGFPVMSLFDCLLRGFPDEVSYAVSSLKLIYLYSSAEMQKMITRMCSPPLHSEKNFQLLAEHPTVLNLEIPPAPGESRRNLIIDFLKSGNIHLNKYVQTFVDLLDSEEDQLVLEYLSSIEPFNPRVISLFMAATAEARARHVAGKLQKTKTIATVARVQGAVDLYSKIIDAEKNHFGSVLRLLYQDHHNTVKWNSDKCSVTHCDELRSKGWGKQVEGVNCVPPQEFMSLELRLENHDCLSYHDKTDGYVAIRLDPSYTLDSFSSPLINGSFPPYRGSVTRQKVSGYGDKIAAQSEPILQKVLRLFSLVGWGIPKDGHLHKLSSLLLSRHTNLESEHLCPPDEEISGSIQHRLQDMRTGHGGSVPVLPNYGTKLMFDTFPLVRYSKGSKNVNLMFQSFMSASVVLIGELLSYKWQSTLPVIHMHVKSNCCVQEITESLCETAQPPLFTLTAYTDNPYLYVDQSKILLLMEKGLRFEINRNLSMDKTDIFYRFHSVLGEECFHLLSPHSWDKPSHGFRTQQLVINWVLPCSVNILLHSIALRLCTHYTGALREFDFQSYLIRVAERVERSPMENWKALSALIFAPDIHHHIVGEGIYSKVSGNPVCTETSFALMLKEAIVSIINTWSWKKDSSDSLHYVDCYGRPYCGLSQHPSMSLLIKDWILGKLSNADIRAVRYGIINRLTHNPQGYEAQYTATLSDYYCKLGKLRITGENLDYLCKVEGLKIPLIHKPSSIVTSIPPGGEVFLTFDINSIAKQSFHLSSVEKYISLVKYTNHLLKIAATPTTGAYKCLAILRLLMLINPLFIAALADGGGGFTKACLLYFKQACVFYNTLIHKEVPIQQSSPIPFVPALAGHKDLEERVIGMNITTDQISDITNESLPDIIYSRVTNKFDLVMCDAEFTKGDPIEKGISLLTGALNVAVKMKSPYLVFKAYLKNVNLLTIQISLLLTKYERVQVFRSYFSSTFNTEVYLIASSLTANGKLTRESPDTWSGDILKPHCVELLYSWLKYFESAPGVDITDIAKIYTSVLNSSEEGYITELRKYVPFAIPGSKFAYPSSVVNWVHETSSKWTGAPQITRVRLETTTLHYSYLRRWAIGFLVCYLLTNINTHMEELSKLIDEGHLIWFRLLDKTWDVSLSHGTPLPSKLTTGIRPFSLKRILKDGDQKLIYRIAGIALQLNITFQNTNTKFPFHIRGYLDVKNKPITPLKRAEFPWAKDTLQYGTVCEPPTTPVSVERPRPIPLRRPRQSKK